MFLRHVQKDDKASAAFMAEPTIHESLIPEMPDHSHMIIAIEARGLPGFYRCTWSIFKRDELYYNCYKHETNKSYGIW